MFKDYPILTTGVSVPALTVCEYEACTHGCTKGSEGPLVLSK
jgi:hypothetical protein